ncbi:MAG: hypothetical protein M1833_004605 [Piccolia ochrophora]|nr:MAG: hypothetical protein M1833_004605 [Piccolia ochrophora]
MVFASGPLHTSHFKSAFHSVQNASSSHVASVTDTASGTGGVEARTPQATPSPPRSKPASLFESAREIPRSQPSEPQDSEKPNRRSILGHRRSNTPSPATSREPSPLPWAGQVPKSQNKMHQTSSRLLRMTDDERPFTRDFMDLFATLMVSLPLNSHRIRFQKVEHTFTSEEAINNLGSLKFSQSNRMPDPKDPSRIVTTTTTTTFSMAREMARSVCQKFMDARFIESADSKPGGTFSIKNGVWHLTPKGLHVLTRFCQRNGINQKHVMEVIDSPRNTMQLVALERDLVSDKLSHDAPTIEVVFRRFIGQEGPNTKQTVSSADSDSLSDYYNGLVGVKMAKERKIFDKVVRNTFTGKAAVDWLMDCSTTIDRREACEIAVQFAQERLIYPVVDDKVYITEHPRSTVFQPTKLAIYALTNKGQKAAGWIARDKSSSSDEESYGRGRSDTRGSRDSNRNRLTVILSDPSLRLQFREYLRDTLCEENLAFYLDVVEFTSSYKYAIQKNNNPKIDTVRETLAAAYGLYNAFLAPGSPCELNIDHNLRNNLASRMTRAVGDDQAMVDSLTEVAKLFDQAQVSVFKLMASDSVPKFLKDPKYATILQEHDFEAAVAAHQYEATGVPERTMSKRKV